MPCQTLITQKKRGPAPTGKGTLIGVRIQPGLLGKLDEWLKRQEGIANRPEAIRRLIESALKRGK